jgi:hypothetical protein
MDGGVLSGGGLEVDFVVGLLQKNRGRVSPRMRNEKEKNKGQGIGGACHGFDGEGSGWPQHWDLTDEKLPWIGGGSEREKRVKQRGGVGEWKGNDAGAVVSWEQGGRGDRQWFWVPEREGAVMRKGKDLTHGVHT